MSWLEFLAYQRYAHKRAIERRNAQAREAAGMEARPPGPAADEWAEHQERLKDGG